MSHRGYVLDGGQNRFDGSGPDLLHDPKVVELYLGGAVAGVRGETGSAIEDEQRPPDAGLEPEEAPRYDRTRWTSRTTTSRSSTS